MGIDYSKLAHPKPALRVEQKRAKRLSDAQLEKDARNAVRHRDGWTCRVPGCKEAGVHLHHVVYRSKSKALRWHRSNLCYLCAAHHAMEHAGRITISGNADEELVITGARKDLAFKL